MLYCYLTSTKTIGKTLKLLTTDSWMRHMHLINYIKEGKLNRQKRDKVKKEKKKAVQVFFCFYFNTVKGMIIDVLGPKIVGLLIGLGLF